MFYSSNTENKIFFTNFFFFILFFKWSIKLFSIFDHIIENIKKTKIIKISYEFIHFKIIYFIKEENK